MNTYFINELNKDVTYIEVRICMLLDCMPRVQKINEVLEFLNRNCFLSNFIFIYDNSISADSFQEKVDVASLTMDICDEKIRFKYWNGSEIFWTYHVQDLFKTLIEGREEYSKIYAKYYPVTNIIRDAEKNFSTIFRRMTYTYYPLDDIEMKYLLVFSHDAKETHMETNILDMINQNIINLGTDITDDLKFYIDFTFADDECIPCQKRRNKNEDKG